MGDLCISSNVCSHQFHKECLLEWLQKSWNNTGCPCCRQDLVTNKQIIDVSKKIKIEDEEQQQQQEQNYQNNSSLNASNDHDSSCLSCIPYFRPRRDEGLIITNLPSRVVEDSDSGHAPSNGLSSNNVESAALATDANHVNNDIVDEPSANIVSGNVANNQIEDNDENSCDAISNESSSMNPQSIDNSIDKSNINSNVTGNCGICNDVILVDDISNKSKSSDDVNAGREYSTINVHDAATPKNMVSPDNQCTIAKVKDPQSKIEPTENNIGSDNEHIICNDMEFQSEE